MIESLRLESREFKKTVMKIFCCLFLIWFDKSCISISIFFPHLWPNYLIAFEVGSVLWEITPIIFYISIADAIAAYLVFLHLLLILIVKKAPNMAFSPNLVISLLFFPFIPLQFLLNWINLSLFDIKHCIIDNFYFYKIYLYWLLVLFPYPHN